jgi:DNA-binding response OmpR family regulator
MGARILIVEDDALLALDLKGHLERAGFLVIGPAATAAKALSLLAEAGCDAAILVSTSAGGKPRSPWRKSCDCAALRS